MEIKRRIYWTKEFDSAHFLDLDYESKCLRLHGHTYRVEVFIEGELDKNNMIFDFNHLSDIVNSFDHKILIPLSKIESVSDNVVYVKTNTNSMLSINKSDMIIIDGNATAEKIAEKILKEILIRSNDNLHSVRVRVWEDPRSYAEVEL